MIFYPGYKRNLVGSTDIIRAKNSEVELLKC